MVPSKYAEGTSANANVHLSERLIVTKEFIPQTGESVVSTGTQPTCNQSLQERESLKDDPMRKIEHLQTGSTAKFEAVDSKSSYDVPFKVPFIKTHLG